MQESDKELLELAAKAAGYEMILTEEEIEEIQNRPLSQNDWLWYYTRAIEQAILNKLQDKLKNAERYDYLVNNSFDCELITQFHVMEHSWEPHSQTKEPVQWVQRASYRQSN